MRILPLALCIVVARGEIIDRVAVSIDNEVITESQVKEDIRITSFLNGEKPDFSGPNKRRAADRLVQQALITREVGLTRYPEPTQDEINAMLKQVRGRYASRAAFEQALQRNRITEGQLRATLSRQAATLRYIDLRFRPEVQVRDADVLQYYETVFLPACRKKGIPEPAFDTVRAQCEEAVAQQLVDKRVETWLEETRSRTRIQYQEAAFQ